MSNDKRKSGTATGAAVGTAVSPGWGTAIGAGLGALGFFDEGDSPTTTNSQAQSSPWRAQQPYLLDLFSEAQRLYQQRMPGYGGAYNLPPGYITALRSQQGAGNVANGAATGKTENELIAQYEKEKHDWDTSHTGESPPLYPNTQELDALKRRQAENKKETNKIEGGNVEGIIDRGGQTTEQVRNFQTQSNGSLSGGRPTQYADQPSGGSSGFVGPMEGGSPVPASGYGSIPRLTNNGNGYTVSGGDDSNIRYAFQPSGGSGGSVTPGPSESPWAPNFNRVAGLTGFQKDAQFEVGALSRRNSQAIGGALNNASTFANPYAMPFFSSAQNANANQSNLLNQVASNASVTPNYDITSEAKGYLNNAASAAPSFSSPDQLYSQQFNAINNVAANQRGDTNVADYAIDRVMSESQGQPTGPDATRAIQSQLSGEPNMRVWQPVIDSTVTDAANRFNREIAPAINHGAIAQGNFGSSKYQQAMGLAASESQKNVQRQLAEMGVRIGTDALGRQAQGIGAAQNQQNLNNSISRGANADVMSAAGLGLNQASLNNTIGRGNNSDILQAAGLGGSLTNSWLDNQQRTAGMQANVGNAIGGLDLNQANLTEGVQQQRQSQLANAAGQYGNQFSSIFQPGLGYAVNMSSQVPDLMQSTYTPWNMMNVYGAQQQAQQQAMLNQQYENWQLNQNGPWDMLAKYGSAVSGNYGGLTNSSTVQNTPSNSNTQTIGALISMAGAFNNNNNSGSTVNNSGYYPAQYSSAQSGGG